MSNRQPLIAGNWKMHKTLAEARARARDIRQGAASGRRAEVALAPLGNVPDEASVTE